MARSKTQHGRVQGKLLWQACWPAALLPSRATTTQDRAPCHARKVRSSWQPLRPAWDMAVAGRPSVSLLVVGVGGARTADRAGCTAPHNQPALVHPHLLSITRGVSHDACRLRERTGSKGLELILW